jgi:hypothetical protein
MKWPHVCNQSAYVSFVVAGFTCLLIFAAKFQCIYVLVPFGRRINEEEGTLNIPGKLVGKNVKGGYVSNHTFPTFIEVALQACDHAIN